MAAYLVLATFKPRTIMPSEDVDYVEEKKPGFIDSRLTIWTSWLNARLRKRYLAPFAAPTPEIVLGWLTDIVTVEAYDARGWNPSDDNSKRIIQAGEDAKAAAKEAADGELGLYDLPLREDAERSGIVYGGPYAYSEPDAYEWTDRQVEVIRGR